MHSNVFWFFGNPIATHSDEQGTFVGEFMQVLQFGVERTPMEKEESTKSTLKYNFII